MKHLDLFAGIGGFSLGLDRAGFETIAFCEIEKFPQKVLAKHWPDVPIANDVTKLTYKNGVLYDDGNEIYRGAIDSFSGGFPCQDISVAGKQAGIGEGTRSGLWSECARLLGEIRPDYAIFENVTALLSGGSGRWFQRVLWDISQVGYDAEWISIRASDVGAEHARDRVWIICYSDKDSKSILPINDETQVMQVDDSNSDKAQFKRGCICERIQQEYTNSSHPRWGKDKPGVDRMANGIPSQMDRLGSLGNAVVPQIPELIGRAIMSYNHNYEDVK
jgi:DNA (cytosine-5)-methyltransferase 1